MSANPVQTPAPGREAPAQSPAPAAPRERSRRWIWGLVLLAGAAAGAYQLWLKPRSAQKVAPVVVYRTAKVVSGVLERRIRVGGQTSARNYANVIAPMLRGPESGRALLLMKLAKSGSFVKKGDLLCQIDGQSAQDHIEDTKDLVKQAENDVLKGNASQSVEWENLLQTSRVALADFNKAKLESGASEIRTVIDQELLKLSLEESEARYKQAEADLKAKKISHAAQDRILQITSIRQHRHLERHVTDIVKYTITSPIDGLVVMTQIWRGAEMGQVQEGDQVSPGQPFMKIVNPRSMQVEGTINQADSGDFRVGQDAIVSLDAFPGLTFKGKVYSIGALAVGGWRQNFYVRNIPVKVAIDGADPRLIPDLSASADVLVASTGDKVPIVPLGAVSTQGDQHFVEVRKGDGFERRRVELGLQDYTRAAVVSGLSEGEEVRLN